ncbi:hypothetical protein Mal48_36760 [Thalassoglobus polymorphus]|uniref:Uncharacterized protein n=1 Tax=Thalassoglobus polymorphus TaxID=2527994 RepID=A0A517QS17_9PLAN|nr:hypothetical protein Mal48_36760 [Thalassoglobus polymorphus]
MVISVQFLNAIKSNSDQEFGHAHLVGIGSDP